MRFDQAIVRARALKPSDPRFFVIQHAGGLALVVRDTRFQSLFQLEGLPPDFVWFSGDVEKWYGFLRTTKPSAYRLERKGDVPLQVHFNDGQALQVLPIYQGENVWPELSCDLIPLDPSRFRGLIGLSSRVDLKDQLRPPLQNLRLAGSWMGAGTEAQLARVRVDGLSAPGERLFPAGGFTKLKLLKRTCPRVGLAGDVLVIDSEGETRRVPSVAERYPRTEGIFESNAPFQAKVTLGASALSSAMKVFRRKEDRRVCRLWTEGAFLNIEASGGRSFLEVEHPPAYPLDVWVQGERLSVLAKTWPVSEVQMSWAPFFGRRTPLRFDAGDWYTELVYPLLEIQNGPNKQILDGHELHRTA